MKQDTRVTRVLLFKKLAEEEAAKQWPELGPHLAIRCSTRSARAGSGFSEPTPSTAANVGEAWTPGPGARRAFQQGSD